jgi:Cu(I)/Ag(I) efflux system protein CusF
MTLFRFKQTDAPQLTSITTDTKRKESTMNSLPKLALATAITLFSASLVFADDMHHVSSSHAAQNSANSSQPAGVEGQMVEGEIKKVDKEAGKITIRHGELKNLGMPAMTMVFRAKDTAMLGQVKAGDKVNFIAQKVAGAFTVVHLENVK